jgi:hypothetical protein
MVYSWEAGLLLPIQPFQLGDLNNRQWSHINLQHWNVRWKMDRLPDFARCRPRHRHSNGQKSIFFIFVLFTHCMSYEQPVVAVQNSLPQSQIPMAMALLIFTQNFMSSVCLTVANTILDSGLETLLSGSSVNAETVMAVGATGIRSAFSGADLNEVLTAYATSIDYIFYLATGLSGLSLIFVLWGMGWRDVHKRYTRA